MFVFYVMGMWYVIIDLSIDLGLCCENYEVNYLVDEDFDGKIIKVFEYDEIKMLWIVGVNYVFNDISGVFVCMN